MNDFWFLLYRSIVLESIRSYACQVVHVTFQRISKRQLRALLGGTAVTGTTFLLTKEYAKFYFLIFSNLFY